MNFTKTTASLLTIGLCLTAFGTANAAEKITEPTSYDGVHFGTDLGEYSNDNECDDPRFEGEGMTDTPLLAADILRDASDCMVQYIQGAITLRTE